MDIWETGRQELAEELKKVCDRIGTSLAAELDHENNIFIARDELEALREKAAKADAFEDEVSSLNRQKRSLEARLGEVGVLTEKNVEIQRLVEHNTRLSEDLEKSKDASLRIDGLEKENKRLAAELKQALNHGQDPKGADASSFTTPKPIASGPSSSVTVPAARSDTDGHHVVAKDIYESLVKKFNTLHENHQLLTSARATLEKALTNKKEKYRGYYDILEKKVQKRDATIKEQGEELQRLRAQVQDITGESRTSTSRIFEENGEQNILNEYSESHDIKASPLELPIILPGVYKGDGDDVVEEENLVALEPYTSTTNGNTPNKSVEESVATETKDISSTPASSSPDAPVVVFARRLRKTKSRQEPTVPSKTPRVKIETISSSPIGLAAMLALDESLDLDDIGEKQSTPRKGRPFLQQALRANSSLAIVAPNETQTPLQSESNSPTNYQVTQETPIRRIGIKRPGSVLQPRSPNTLLLPRTSAERAKKRRRVISDQAVSDLFEDGQVLSSTESSRRKNTHTPDQAKLLPDLLFKPTPPKHVLGADSAVSSRTTKEPVEPARPTCKESMRLKELSRPSSRDSPRSSVEPSRPASKGGFKDSVYESRATSRDSPETRLGSPTYFRPSLKTPNQVQPPSSRATVGVLSGRQRPSPGSLQYDMLEQHRLLEQQKALKSKPGTPSSTRNPPLRTRPLDELMLHDFKVNPKYNQGYGYAFREVVRKQADRRCLPGCTKPDCCGGQFRVLAEALRDPDKPLTLSQEEADDRILQEFLGDNAYKLRNMTKTEREETLMQALTRDMANKMGKHRHAYERRQSPPGYWRSDFPNTQEQVQDRAKAKEVECEQLAHRYEEAMRGGAYIFRDE
ncbi:Akt phosphorylation enhancer [Hyphodiscus hymeniophilus]|uniref:Akt phosphorylation enhancer n=1 Tax=Hyphodiscus hymeniophilus TaxID=353542 RepID=A0A9P6VR23_9HELO|nr:Akt phosphorylation enhancer [Hyphodiscus hymeniophilus]